MERCEKLECARLVNSPVHTIGEEEKMLYASVDIHTRECAFDRRRISGHHPHIHTHTDGRDSREALVVVARNFYFVKTICTYFPCFYNSEIFLCRIIC